MRSAYRDCHIGYIYDTAHYFNNGRTNVLTRTRKVAEAVFIDADIANASKLPRVTLSVGRRREFAADKSHVV